MADDCVLLLHFFPFFCSPVHHLIIAVPLFSWTRGRRPVTADGEEEGVPEDETGVTGPEKAATAARAAAEAGREEDSAECNLRCTVLRVLLSVFAGSEA